MKKSILICLAFLALLSPGTTRPARRISPSYDVYIGFLATGPCPPPRWGNAYFKRFSFDSAIRNVQFEFGDATVRNKKYNWWFASLDVSPAVAIPPLIGSFGEGDISLADLCPYWNVDNHGKPLKCTLVKVKNKFTPGMSPVDVGHIARKKNILDPAPVKAPGPDELPIERLVPPWVFEYDAFFYKQTEVTCEQSDGKPELTNITFCSILPESELMAGKEVTYEFPFKIPEVIDPGVLTIRYMPVKKK